MHILTRWGFRMVRANRSRTVTVILAVIGFFALGTGASFIVSAVLRDADSTGSIHAARLDLIGIGDYLFRAIVDYLLIGQLIGLTAILFSIFSVTADECRHDSFILRSSGASARQIRCSLVLRALTLSVGGGAGGVAIGLLAARFLLQASLFYTELPHFFWEPRTIEMLLVGLLLPPCLMALASVFAFRGSARRKRLRKPKHDTFHRSFAGRVFGIGGVLGRLNSKKNYRYRVIFTAAFAICLAVPAMLNSVLQIFADARMVQEGFDMSVDCWNLETDSDQLGSDVLDELLLQNADRFSITDSTTITEYGHDFCYTLLDSDWISDAVSFGTPVEQDGKTMQLCKNEFRFAFLDDATFDRLVRENGFTAAENGAILYNAAYDAQQMHPLQTVDPDRDVTLYFLPDAFIFTSSEEWMETQKPYKPIYYASNDEFLRVTEPAAEAITIRLSGMTQTLPFDLEDIAPTILFPDRMYPSLADRFSSLYAISDDGSERIPSTKIYLCRMTDPAAGVEALRNAVKSDPRFSVFERMTGLGRRSVTIPEIESDETRSQLVRGITICDLAADRERFGLMQTLIPQLQTLLLAMSAWILFVGILNTAHMNRITRRREKAILDSIGMEKRQKTGMLLYESLRYAMCSALLGFAGFVGLFRFAWGFVSELLRGSSLQREGWRVQIHFYDPKNARPHFPHDLVEACSRTWWVFAGGAVLIFVLLVVIDKAIDRRSKREELIQILKDDSQDYSM